MKIATIAQLKKELKERPQDEVIEMCLRLAKFRNENKELLTYLLFEAGNEEGYIATVKEEVTNQLVSIYSRNSYLMRKSVRKVLKDLKRFIRFSQKKETEVELLLDFCFQLKDMYPSILKEPVVKNLWDRQLQMAQKRMLTLHEDLQFDYQNQIDELLG